VLLRHFIGWLVGVNLHGLGGDFPLYLGWALAAGLGCTGYVQCLVHHQLFWCALLALHSPCMEPCALRWCPSVAPGTAGAVYGRHLACHTCAPLRCDQRIIGVPGDRVLCAILSNSQQEPYPIGPVPYPAVPFSIASGPPRRVGMRTGYMMRQQAIAAVYAKVLRLNSASIGDVSAGKARPWAPHMLT